VVLRPIEEAQLPNLLRLLVDPHTAGEFQWFGHRVTMAKELQRRWPEDGLLGGESCFLAVCLDEETCAGWVTWRSILFGNCEIGIALFPEFRGRGIGTAAQQLLVDHLFSTTTAHRLQAGTEVGNIAEQRALERVGFRREGVLRGVAFRAGKWRDGVMYGLLREETKDPPNSRA
jgi:[ribosomal protein S5]-alanine N-acetyltransferase